MLDNRIYTFLTLCKTMNYRITAEKLNMTQPAVTQHIKYLEQEYNCKLFIYDGRKLSKTYYAEVLEEYSKTAVYNQKALYESLKNTGKINIRLGATKTIGDYIIPDMVCEFLKNKTNSLSLIVENTEFLLKKIDNNELDFALIEGFFAKEKYGYRLFRNEDFIGICGKNHRFSGKEIELEDLFDETIIVRENGSGTKAILEQFLSERNFSLDCFKNELTISNFITIKKLVEKNIGISFVYKSVLCNNDNISTFKIKKYNIEREFNYVFLKNTTAENLIDYFEKQ